MCAAKRILKAFEEALKLLKKKRGILLDLESAMDPAMLAQMKVDRLGNNGKQYRPRTIEFPTRMDILKRVQKEEAQKSKTQVQDTNQLMDRTQRSSRLTGSVGINMGLDLEMRQ